MKKELLALSVAALVVSGCTNHSGSNFAYDSQNDNGPQIVMPTQESITQQAYQPSDITDIETVRSGVNSAFLIAQPVYEQFLTHLNTEPALGDYFSSVGSAKTEDEKQAAFDLLSAENRTALSAFMNSEASKQVIAKLVDAAKTAMVNIAQFQALDTASLMTDVGVLELINEKDKLAQTVDQVDYLNSTVISAYNNYTQVAKLIKTE